MIRKTRLISVLNSALIILSSILSPRATFERFKCLIKRYDPTNYVFSARATYTCRPRQYDIQKRSNNNSKENINVFSLSYKKNFNATRNTNLEKK